MTNTILEAVLTEHEDDTLDHYGVKGMKWGQGHEMGEEKKEGNLWVFKPQS